MAFLLAALGGPMLFLSCLSVYQYAQGLKESVFLKEAIILGWILVWLCLGISQQFKLHHDRRWEQFVRKMPVPPRHIIFLYFCQSFAINMICFILLIVFVCGINDHVGYFAIGAKWSAIGICFFWVVAFQCALGFVLTRFSQAQKLLWLILILWLSALIGRSLWHNISFFEMESLAALIHQDPLLIALGVVSLLDLFTGNMGYHLAPTVIKLLCPLAVSLCFIFISFRSLRLTTISTGMRPRGLSISTRFKKWISHVWPSTASSQIYIEGLLTLRGEYLSINFYALACVITAIGLGIMLPDGNTNILILIFFSFLLSSESPSILRSRHYHHLYKLYGVDTKEFLWGFVISIGGAYSLLCVLMIPFFLDTTLILAVVIKTICVCMAVSCSLICITVMTDSYCRNLKSSQHLIGAIIYLLRTGWVQIPIFSLGLILTLVGLSYSGLLALLAGLLMCSLQIRSTSRPIVENLYWGITRD